MALRDYSQTPGSNTTIGGINVDEGCNPSNVNNAIRQLMADAKELQAASTIAAASTTSAGAANTVYVTISGNTTITAFDNVAAGLARICDFTSALTLTHDATSFILPGAANITTAAGDAMLAVSKGSGNWKVALYERASGAPLALGASQVTTAYLADNAVTGDKIAAGALAVTKFTSAAPGTLVSWDADGNVTAVPHGTAGQVLTSNGTAQPTFQAISQALVLIASATADNSSPRIAITTGLDSTSYDEFLLTVEALLPATDDTTLSVQVSNDAGSAWATSSYLSACSWNVAGSAGGTAATSGVIMVRNAGTANVANDDTGWSGEVRIWPRGTSKKKIITFHGGYATASAGIAAVTGSGIYNGDNAAVTGISIVTGAGNITSGTVRLYGVKNT